MKYIPIIFVLILSSCGHFKKEENSPRTVPQIISSFEKANPSLVKSPVKTPAKNDDQQLGKPKSQKDEDLLENLGPISLEKTALVNKWIHYFSKRDRARFQRMLDRGERYRELVETILEENGVPKELYYLALIESGYVKHAKSRAKAVGVWQFIAPTGRRYGLRVSGHVDDRKDPIRATEAAAKYLRSLYNAFQSWELAMAAYNCGEYCVLGAIMRSGSRSFDELVSKRKLPRETRNYVPKLKAAIIVGEGFKKFGFKKNRVDEIPNLELVEVPGNIHLKKISQLLGIPEKLLVDYNSQLKRKITSSRQDKDEIWIPEERKDWYLKNQQKLSKLPRAKRTRARSFASNTYYRVRKGDSLSHIAQWHNLSISRLKKINNLRGNKIFVGQKLRVSSKSYRHVSANKSNISSSSNSRYKVKRGDSLASISKKFDIPISKIKKINRLRKNTIFAGQYLNLKGHFYYRVRKGDSLFKIAKKFRTSVKRIKLANQMKRNVIRKGEKLKIVL